MCEYCQTDYCKGFPYRDWCVPLNRPCTLCVMGNGKQYEEAKAAEAKAAEAAKGEAE